jgi:1-acyl-sn-glycerol-3-phosphate acyltransferase
MRALAWMVNTTIHGLTHLLCRVDTAQLQKVPARGPLILATNHINFLEVPVLRIHLRPRPIAGLAKAEAWENPIIGFLFNLWGAIPIRRGESDLGALRKGLAALKEGAILTIAPEGTRSHHGRLQRGHPGIVSLALHSGAPILPLVFYGGETFKQNFSRLRRTPFHIVVGDPFYLRPGERTTRDVRQEIADEIMYQLAALLPPPYRGVYSDFTRATDTHLEFRPPSKSNLLIN